MPEARKLEQFDLAKITLEDLRLLKNNAVRDALVEMVRNPGSLVASGHQNHGSHENHSTDASRFLETIFIQNLAREAARKG